MGRLLAIDYGRRRSGIAVTDPRRIVANALTTVETGQLIDYICRYVASEPVDAIVVGHPTTLKGEDSDSMRYITPGINRLKKLLPGMPVIFFDERFTSALAHRAMIDSGVKRMGRRDKGAVDRMAATIILNDFLVSQAYMSDPDFRAFQPVVTDSQ